MILIGEKSRREKLFIQCSTPYGATSMPSSLTLPMMRLLILLLCLGRRSGIALLILLMSMPGSLGTSPHRATSQSTEYQQTQIFTTSCPEGREKNHTSSSTNSIAIPPLEENMDIKPMLELYHHQQHQFMAMFGKKAVGSFMQSNQERETHLQGEGEVERAKKKGDATI